MDGYTSGQSFSYIGRKVRKIGTPPDVMYVLCVTDSFAVEKIRTHTNLALAAFDIQSAAFDQLSSFLLHIH